MNKRIALLPRVEIDHDHEMPADMLEGEQDAAGSRSTLSGRTGAEATAAATLAERAVVGALLRDNTLYDDVASVARQEDFGDAAAGAAYRGIAAILEGAVDGISRADPIAVASLHTVASAVPLEALSQWMGAASVETAAVLSHAQVVHDAAADRRLREVATKAASIAAGEGSVQERASEVQKLLAQATEGKRTKSTSLGMAAVCALQNIAQRAQQGLSVIGLSTGFADLDALLAGLHPGQLIILAARPGIGKTAFAMCMALAAATAGHAVAMASLEMQAQELSKRAISVISGIDSHALRIGALSEQDWEAAVAASERLVDLPFEVLDNNELTLASLVATCRRLKREGKLDLLIVDYLQIMETAAVTRHATREQAVAALSRGLKRLAMNLQIPVVALSQLNRAVESRLKGRPQMSDLRESGAIEQDADVIIFIHREGSVDGIEPDESAAEIIVAKQREGPTGVIRTIYSRRTTAFASACNEQPINHSQLLQAA